MSTIRLTLRLRSGSDALFRVLSVCHRRHVAILELAYAADEMTITLSGADDRARRIGRVLIGGLVDVIEVSEVAETEPAAPRRHAARSTR